MQSLNRRLRLKPRASRQKLALRRRLLVWRWVGLLWWALRALATVGYVAYVLGWLLWGLHWLVTSPWRQVWPVLAFAAIAGVLLIPITLLIVWLEHLQYDRKSSAWCTALCVSVMMGGFVLVTVVLVVCMLGFYKG